MTKELLQQALDALELQPRVQTIDGHAYSHTVARDVAIHRLKQALAQQEQPTQEASATWTEMVVANLVREGVNKHRARELAAHFLTLPTQPALSESQITSIAYNCNALPEVITDKTLVDFVRAIEAHCRGGANHG